MGSWEPRWERREGRARYLQQGQDPRETDATAAERRAGNKDASLVEHLVPSMGAGRRRKPLWVPMQQAGPSRPQALLSRGPPAPHRPAAHPLTLLTSDTAEHDSGMCSGRTGAQTAAKSRHGRWTETCGAPPRSLLPPLPAALTHKSLIDEILRKVNQDQRDDVPQQALEESEDMSRRLAGGHWPQGGTRCSHHPYLEHGPLFLKGEAWAGVCREQGGKGR